MSVLTCFGIKPRKTKKLKLNSLPDEMLVNIFKYLDCRSLRSVRLVAKRFYYIIDNNITKMQRPKVEYLNISDRDIFFHVYADLIYTRFDNNIVTIRQLKVEEENKLIGYFKYIDTEEMKNLNVSCHKDPKIFMFLGRVFKDGFSVKTLHLSIERDECFDYVGKLFDNIKSFKIVYFEPFFSNSNKIQSKVLPLVLTSLEKNGIYQFKGKNMGLSPVISELIKNNSRIEKLSFYTSKTRNDDDIIKIIRKYIKNATNYHAFMEIKNCGDFFLIFQLDDNNYDYIYDQIELHFNNSPFSLHIKYDSESNVLIFPVFTDCRSCSGQVSMKIYLNNNLMNFY